MATRISKRRHWPFAALLLFCTGLARGGAGDSPAYTYRASTTEVRLNFSAMDQHNHGVATLQASDFAVVDKEVIVRDFQSFTRSDWTRLEIAVLADSSESATPHFRQEVDDVLNLLAQSAGVPEQNLFIFSFDGSRPALLCSGDCRSSHAADRLPPADPHGLTPLFDTIAFAADYLSCHGDPHAQKILIVLSDGVDTISRHSLHDAIDASLRAEISLDSIDLNQHLAWSQGGSVLRALATATGGRYFPPPDGATTALNLILEDFRASYAVSYRLPTHASGFHTIRILPTHNLNLQFRSRSGYYYPNYIR